MKTKPLNKVFKTKSDSDLFNYIMDNLQNTIKYWDWFINFDKVKEKFFEFETELNLLNVLIGKKDIQKELANLIFKYPSVIKAIRILIAARDDKIEVLVNKSSSETEIYDFNKTNLSEFEAKKYAEIFTKTGLGELLSDKTIKSIPDYLIGVEAGLDTNARKNRTGKIMKKLVKEYLLTLSREMNFDFVREANKKKIKDELGLDVNFDKSKSTVDFAINYKNKLYIIEVNFYNVEGSKLKASAVEYIDMNKRYTQQGIKFAWITDGKGWEKTREPLKEFFDSSDYLFNIKMMHSGSIEYFLK
ncbi:MAG: type II restriction endonuclease, partial [Alphaproteobacteria bacterium]|nr:type II restriction endonuclease [Alphaproteobacteria bacterium]